MPATPRLGRPSPRGDRRLEVMSRARRIRTASALVAVVALAIGAAGAGQAPSAARGDTGSAVASAPAGLRAALPAPGRVDVGPSSGSTDAEARRIVAGWDTARRAAAVVMGSLPGTDPAALSGYMSGGYGGFLLMGSNVPGDPAALRAETAALVPDRALPPLIAVDEEGGDVTRLPWDGIPAADVLKTAGAGAVRSAFAARGALVAQSGISVNFGVVADVSSGPGSFIHDRSFGTDPAAAADRVAAAVRGEHPFAVTALKHFPGHGAAEGDSHSSIPTADLSLDDWRRVAAPPFQAGIDAGAPMVMMGHLSFPAVDRLPASLSPRWHRILREELGFTGVVVTDDLGMLPDSGDPDYADVVHDAVRALAAGCDLLLTVNGSDAATAGRIADGVVAAVASGEVPEDRLADAAARVVALRLQIAAAAPGWRPCPECAPAT